VRKEGEKISVIATVESGRNGTAIVTKDFEAPASGAAALADRVSSWVASTVSVWIAQSRIEPDPAITDEILRMNNAWAEDSRSWSLSRDLARANPNSASTQAVFALSTADALSKMPREQRATAIAAARNAADLASKLQPQFGYILPCKLTPPGGSILTAECDRALRHTVATDPEPPYASLYFAGQLAQSGLFREADRLMAGDLAQSPYDPIRLSLRTFALEMKRPGDRADELSGIRARAQRYAPWVLKDDFHYEAAIANGNVAAASALLNDPTTGDSIDSDIGKDIDNAVFRAISTRASADAAAARGKCLPPPNWLPPSIAFQSCLVGLTMLGDLDAAFRLAHLGYRNFGCCTPAEREKVWLDGGGLHYPRYVLWGSAMAPFRADPRFIDVARRTGLLAYWKSGHPPDFCNFERVPVCALLRSP
jgi:hypothetical protein